MSGRPVRWPVVLLGTIACGEAGTSLAAPIPVPSVSNSESSPGPVVTCSTRKS